MAKLHEILAVEGDLEATAKKIAEEAIDTFRKKPDHFVESVRSLTMFDENRSGENTREHKAMVTTVADKLGWVKKVVSKSWDNMYAKERANQEAKADLVVDGVVIAKAVPATMLLSLESRLKALREVYASIPTLQPGIDWQKDGSRKDTYRSAAPEVRMKTEKTLTPVVLYEATKEHPAQVKELTSDKPVGRIEEQKYSSMLSPADKSDMLERVDNLLRAVKKARQRANTVEATKIKIGELLFDYVHNGSKATS